MKIQINKKDYKIKPASEMSVQEYITFFGKLSEEPTQFEVLIAYVSAITGLNYTDIEKINIDDNSIRRLMVYIGEIQAPNQIKTIDYFYHKKSGKRIYQKTLEWRTFGARKLLEEKRTDNQLELAVYLLAVYVAGNYDAEKIEEIYSELMDYNAVSVFGFVIFFFKRLANGAIQEKSYLKRLILKVFTNILKR